MPNHKLSERSANERLTSAEPGSGSNGSPRAARSGVRSRRIVAIGLRLVSSDAAMVFVAFALMLAIWEGITLTGSLKSYVLPSPVSVWHALVQADRTLEREALTTLVEVVAGFIIAAFAGILIAIAIVYVRVFERVIYPFLVTSQAVPKVAIAPIIVAWLGIGTAPRIVLAALLAIFPIIVSTVVGLKEVDPMMMLMGRSTGATRLQVFWRIRLPNAMPSVFGGLKVGVTLSVVGAVVGEFMAGSSGLGYVINSAQASIQMELAIAALVVLSVEGIVLFYVIEAAERLFMRRGRG